jgi:uncharacterized alkaline shock family protein YloU
MDKIDKTTEEKPLGLDRTKLATTIGEIASEVYGVVGLTRVHTLKNQLVILRKENYVDGIILTTNKGKIDLEIHLVCAYGVKITEVASEVAKRVRYELEKKYGKIINKFDVYVEDLLDL